jgi:hypothetical protein
MLNHLRQVSDLHIIENATLVLCGDQVRGLRYPELRYNLSHIHGLACCQDLNFQGGLDINFFTFSFDSDAGFWFGGGN